MLKFLLQHHEMEERSIPVTDPHGQGRECFNRGFLDRREDRPGNGTVIWNTYYKVKDALRTILEEIFYPSSS
jgi:hypothetical protein